MDAARSAGTDDDDVVATLQLPHDARAAGIARRFVEEHSEHLPSELIEDAQLLVSEIVGNAVRHGRPDITLRVRTHPPGIGVAVIDTGDGLPEVPGGPPPPTQPSGRGLLIVDALATEWGVSPKEPPPGKVVWFDLRP
jgi:anti-sigma regulatory factor (Ser/Thr protein kinase)